MRTNRIAFVGTLAATLAGCYSIHTYRGNGELTDNGPDWIMGGRYVLNLGAIRLDELKVYSYDMAELPPRYRFTVGFDIAHSVDMVREVETHVHIEMLNEMGERVLSVDAPLNEWAHSHALGVPEVYAYRRGTSYDRPILGSNSVDIVHIYTGGDCGWGTYFSTRTGGEYRLTVAIAPAPDDSLEEATLIVKDVGHDTECTTRHRRRTASPPLGANVRAP